MASSIRVAWFRPSPEAEARVTREGGRPSRRHPVDDTPLLLAELGSRHTVEVYDARRAHDFVWQHARQPFDVCVYELSDAPAAAFVYPYLLHFPGIARVRTTAGGAQLRQAILASRLTVVADSDAAAALQDACPDARVRTAPIAVGPVESPGPSAATPVIAVAGTSRFESVARAADRAREAGAQFELREPESKDGHTGSDVVIALDWPPAAEPPVAALQAIAAGRVAVVYEAAATAGWPAFDPQTWQPRGYVAGEAPVVVSIDPLDEEHSLMLAIRRLTADAPFRVRLGTAAQAWWRAHATPERAAAAWEPLLQEAARVDPPRSYRGADGSEHTRAILSEFGVSVDFW